jgi:nitroimidazol reductase NimA-like FMN-containing flavoprotein (pyridoxamine 5'-phosphate oxidase superfamily)
VSERVEDFMAVRRHAERGRYEREVIDAILDEARYCTVGFVDDGLPVVIPTIHVRIENSLVLHGSPASRMLRLLKTGSPCAIGVTLLDGLVLARSVFNHSMNYRSVVMLDCRGRELEGDEKLEAMQRLTDKLVPGRWDDARRPSDKEIRGTTLVSFPIDLASARIRSGPPVDDEADYDLGVWAGVIPLQLVAGEPVPDPRLAEGIAVPPYLIRPDSG